MRVLHPQYPARGPARSGTNRSQFTDKEIKNPLGELSSRGNKTSRCPVSFRLRAESTIPCMQRPQNLGNKKPGNWSFLHGMNGDGP